MNNKYIFYIIPVMIPYADFFAVITVLKDSV